MRRAIAIEKPIYGDNYRIAVLTGILAQALAGDAQYVEAEAEMISALHMVEADAELKNRAARMRASLAAIRSGAGHCAAARETLPALKVDFPTASQTDEKEFIDTTSKKVDACVGATSHYDRLSNCVSSDVESAAPIEKLRDTAERILPERQRYGRRRQYRGGFAARLF